MSDTIAHDRHDKPAKLPVWKTISEAYAAFFENLASVLKITWLWLIVLGLLAYYNGEQQSHRSGPSERTQRHLRF